MKQRRVHPPSWHPNIKPSARPFLAIHDTGKEPPSRFLSFLKLMKAKKL
jgi:hypothetical protein